MIMELAFKIDVLQVDHSKKYLKILLQKYLLQYLDDFVINPF